MADTKISAATLTTPASTDLFPFERPGSDVARRATGSAIARIGAIDIFADDYANLQLAVDAATTLLDNKYGQSRQGRAVVRLSPGTVYTLSAPLNLCNKQGIIIDGGAPNCGAVIHSTATGKAAIECIGSQNIQFRNLEIYGDQSSKPKVGIMISRSTETHGSNAVQITFDHVMFYGYYSHACYYGVETESNWFYNCRFEPVDIGTAGALAYFGAHNSLSITPDNATLLGAGYGPYNTRFSDCSMISSADCRSIYARDLQGPGLTVRDTYIYGNSDTYPTIEIEGSGTTTFDNIFFEGTPGTRVKYSYNASYVNYFFGQWRDMTWGNAKNYLIHADDSTDLRNLSFTGYHTMSPYSGAYAPISVYDTHLSDYRGLAYYQGGVFNLTARNDAVACNFRLGPDDTLTLTNDYGNFVEDFSTSLKPYLNLGTTYGNLKIGYAWNAGHLIMGACHLWIDGSGNLRVNYSGTPANDTDGTIIGP